MQTLLSYLLPTPPSFQSLKLAVWKQQVQKIPLLIKQGAPLRSRTQSILHYAVQEGKAEVLDVLPIRELVSERNQDGDTAVMVGIFCGGQAQTGAPAGQAQAGNWNKIIINLLNYSDVNARDGFGNTIPILLAANGNLEVLEYLLREQGGEQEDGIKIGGQGKEKIRIGIGVGNYQGQTALHRAAYHGELQVIKFLVNRAKLKFCTTDRNGNNALHFACQGCNLVCIRYIIHKVTKPEKLMQNENKQGKKPLQVLQQMINKLNSFKKGEKAVKMQDVLSYIFGKQKENKEKEKEKEKEKDKDKDKQRQARWQGKQREKERKKSQSAIQ